MTAFDWRRFAACRDMDAGLWFPALGESNDPAKEICARCPALKACLEEHLGERYGIWGGMTYRERQAERRRRRNNEKKGWSAA